MFFITTFFSQEKMMMVNVNTNLFISSNCACRPNVMEWCPSTSRIIFASKNDICIAEATESNKYFGISKTINAHKDEIICIKLAHNSHRNVTSPSSSSVICSSSANGELALWKIEYDNVTAILKEKRKSSIPLAKVFMVDGSNLLIANANIDKVEYKYFDMKSTGQEPLATLDFPESIVLSMDFAQLASLVLLVVGLSTGNVQIFYTPLGMPGKFDHCMVLSIEPNCWVRSLSFKENDNHLFMASSSDNFIKIWSLKELAEEDPEESPGELKLTPRVFKVGKDLSVSVKLESTLSCHEIVHSIYWHPSQNEFLSSGANSVVRWKYSEDEEHVWLPVSRVGEMHEERNDYYDGIYSPDGTSFLCHSLYGALLLWKIQDGQILPKSHTIGGHFDRVSDICWDPTGSYLLTTSFDKTTRLYTSLKDHRNVFFEIARPQIHGHSLNCVAAVSSTTFVSGGEEKIFRVFEANSTFAKNMHSLAGISINETAGLLSSGAYQTELSLTNKRQTDDELEEQFTGQQQFEEPPREDQLNKFTLFPEIQKLYGHGFEVFAIASNHAGTLIATSCRASVPEHAAVFLWDTKEWQHRGTLKAHQLTVTQLSFSKDDQFLISVSRDRTWTLFQQKDLTSLDYSIYHQTNVKNSRHSRIIWSCAWSHDSLLFATASRDKMLNIWSPREKFGAKEEAKEVRHIIGLLCEDSITAVDFAPRNLDSKFIPHSNSSESSYLCAIGLDNGTILILGICPFKPRCHVLRELSKDLAHSGSVTRIRFRPKNEAEGSENHEYFDFASSAANNVVKIHSSQFIGLVEI